MKANLMRWFLAVIFSISALTAVLYRTAGMIPTGIGMGTTITIEETGTIIGQTGTIRTTATGVKIQEGFYFLEEGSAAPSPQRQNHRGFARWYWRGQGAST
jgi:hypothetical protein